MSILEQLLLAYAGFLFHLLKIYQANVKRKETFINQQLLVWVLSNLLAATLLIYIGGTLPPDLLVMSPLTCVIIGFFGSSMLSGFINIKKPKGFESLEYDTEDPVTGIKTKTKFESQTTTTDDGGSTNSGDTGGSNPPPDKPRPDKP